MFLNIEAAWAMYSASPPMVGEVLQWYSSRCPPSFSIACCICSRTRGLASPWLRVPGTPDRQATVVGLSTNMIRR